MPTLNEEAYRIVRLKEPVIAALPGFSIVFMGDSHVGMASCTARGLPRSIDQYERLLNEIKSRNTGGRTLAIIHGGDGTHVGEENLRRFIDTTARVLYPSTLTDLQKIPLFMNAGNHEYKSIDPKTGMLIEGVPTGYETLVQANVLTQSTTKAKHPDVQVIPLNALKLRVVLLNTGYSNYGDFAKIDNNKFRREVMQLDDWMSTFKGSDVRFVIDMHIPPNIGRFGMQKVPNPYVTPAGGQPPTGLPHVLNDTYNALFTQHVLSKHKDQIIAVVSHHRHCLPINNSTYPPVLTVPQYPNIQFYLTPAAGQCNTVCGGTCNPAPCNSTLFRYPYHAIRINFDYAGGAGPIRISPANSYDIIHLS